MALQEFQFASRQIRVRSQCSCRKGILCKAPCSLFSLLRCKSSRALLVLISVRTSLFGTMTRVRACSLPRRAFSPVHMPQHCLFVLPSCFCFEKISPNHSGQCPAFITFWQNSSSVSAFPLALLAFHLLACFPCHSISPHGAPLRR